MCITFVVTFHHHSRISWLHKSWNKTAGLHVIFSCYRLIRSLNYVVPGVARTADSPWPARSRTRRHGHTPILSSGGRLQLLQQVAVKQRRQGSLWSDTSGRDGSSCLNSNTHQGIPMRMDSTEEQPGPGRLINHSKCHANVSTAISSEVYIYHLTNSIVIFWTLLLYNSR